MKMKKIVVSMFVAGVVVSPAAFATNGDTMIAVGSQNTALGGTGVAHFVGAESAFANPALLGMSKGDEVTGGLVIFQPDVKNDGMGGVSSKSAADNNFIPDVSYSTRSNENLTYGIAMAGIAGMGVDYTGANPMTHMQAKTTLSILKIIPTIAYNTESYGVGFSPVLQYGSLAISYTTPGGATNPGHNASTDTNLGFNVGGYFNPSSAVTLAAAYNSKISMKYGTQLSVAGTGFGQTFADQLDQPAEVKVGVSLNASENFLVTMDYRQIQWSSAGGYREFGWKDQDVVAIGAKYSGDGYWLGAGFNSANNPITQFNGTGGATTPWGNNGGTVNMFNNLMFPATIKNSYTFGGGMAMSEHTDFEGSIMYAPKVTTMVDVTDPMVGFGAPLGGAPYFNTTTHSQVAVSISLRHKF
ncbi:MAG: outer membrane protein transport protein [Gallionella sp.]|nr:outer membrane protein transport protein [Gallionella sp.]